MNRTSKPRPTGNEGIAKGYRLKAETHELINRLQKKINGTKDDVISRACEKFFEELQVNNNRPKETGNH